MWFMGLLLNLLRAFIEEFRELLADNNLSTRVIEPQPGERFQLQLQRGLAT